MHQKTSHHKNANQKSSAQIDSNDKHEIRPGQSIDLLKELHILTRDGKMNQDSRRKLKQVYHLYQFIEPLLLQVQKEKHYVSLVDHGAGKSYLGFILYDLFFKELMQVTSSLSTSSSSSPSSLSSAEQSQFQIFGIETREELVQKSKDLAARLGFQGMSFLNLSVAQSIGSTELPEKIDIVTTLHACNTATDDAIHFALKKQAQFMVLVPCCQAEVAAELKKNKSVEVKNNPMSELWRHPLHTREFGSQITNVLRCLQLEAHGYQVRVTELVGWEHSMKNELIIAEYKGTPSVKSSTRLKEVLQNTGLENLKTRFFTP